MHGASQDKAIDREELGSTSLSGSTENEASLELSAVARAKSERLPSCEQKSSVPPPQATGRLAKCHRAGSIVAVAQTCDIGDRSVAALVSLMVWDQYVIAPWTRDGRVRVQVASVAPRVSGQITQLQVADNQFVHKGDVLYQIEPFDFDVALRLSKAVLEQREADSYVKELQSERRKRLSELSTSREQQQIFEGSDVSGDIFETRSSSTKTLIRTKCIPPKHPLDTLPQGREAHRVTPAALEAHRQSLVMRIAVRMSEKGSRSDACTHRPTVLMLGCE